MRSILLSIVLIAAMNSSAQNEVILHINHLVNDAPFSLNEPVSISGEYELEFVRMEYYLSDFTITHDGGQQTFLDETHLLVDANGESEYSLGTWDIDNVEAISFSVGVDEAHNHLDPATYSMGHPLAPQFPSMHWGWASGYRFVAAEGETGVNFTSDWQIHALGDNNFFSQSHDMSFSANSGYLDLWLDANYEEMFNELDVSSGLIEHSDTDEAIDLLENMRDHVFAAGQPVGVSDHEWIGLNAFPNPANDQIRVVGVPADSQVEVLDLQGAIVRSIQPNGLALIDVQDLANGLYFLRIQNGGAQKTIKVQIKH